MCPELTSIFGNIGGPCSQNCINVRLVQNNVYLEKTIRCSNRQPFLLPTAPGTPLNPEDLHTGTLHGLAIFSFCFSQTGHWLNLPIAPLFHDTDLVDGHRRFRLDRLARLRQTKSPFNYPGGAGSQPLPPCIRQRELPACPIDWFSDPLDVQRRGQIGPHRRHAL